MAVISSLVIDGVNKDKHENSIITNINYGLDFDFAKNTEVIGGVCDNAVEEPIIDMKISGNSVQSKLPSEYREVEYIESTGTQYIDTEYIPKINTTVELTLSFNGTFVGTSGSASFIGSAEGNNRFQLNFGSRETQYYQIYAWVDKATAAGGETYPINIEDNIRTNKNVLSFQSGSIKYGNVEQTIATKTEDHTNVSLVLFGRNLDGVKSAFTSYNMRLYDSKFYENGTLVRHFIPCYRKADNVIGLYDLVEKKFYTNNGTGEFSIGSNTPTPTPTPEAPIEVESVGERTKNLLPIINDISYTIYNTTLTIENDTFTLNGTATSNYQFGLYIENGQLKVINGVIGVERNNPPLIKKLEAGTYNLSLKYLSGTITSTGATKYFGLYTYKNGSTALDARYTFDMADRNNQFSITADKEAQFFVIQIVALNKELVFDNYKFKVQLEKGSTATEYEPYGYKVPVNVSGENLFDNTKVLNGFLPQTGAYPTTNASYPKACYQIINLKAGQTVKIDFYNNEDKNGRIRYIDNDTNEVVGTIIEGTTDYYTSTQTFNNGFKDGEITALKDFKLGIMYVRELESNFDLQVNLTSTTNIYIKEPLRRIGDYADYIDYKNKKVVRKIVEKVFYGTEDIRNLPTNPYPYTFWDIGEVGTVIDDINLCTHLQYQPNFSYQVQGDNKFRVLNSVSNNSARVVFRFYLNGAIVYNLDQVKALLTEYYNEGKPMIVYYAHADGLETQETIDIPEITTSKGTNIFNIDTTIEPSELKVNYWKQI